MRLPGRGAGLEHRTDGAARRRVAGHRAGHDRRPAVRLVDAVQLQRGRGRVVGPARCRRRRGRRVDVPCADGIERWRPLRPAARALGDRSAGDLGRADRGGVGAVARGARRLRVRVAPARAGRDRRGSVRERDRARRGDEPARGHRFRGGRDAARGHVSGGAGRAEAGVSARGTRDGRKLEPDLRRGRRGAGRQRGRVLGSGSSLAHGSCPSGSPGSIPA